MTEPSASRYVGFVDDYLVGYHAVGPLVSGFCQWMRRALDDAGHAGPVFFLARDAKLFFEAFRILCPRYDARYVYISRRSVDLALLEENPTAEGVKASLAKTRYAALAEVLSVLRVQEAEQETLAATYGVPLHQVFSTDELYELDGVKRLLQSQAATIERRARTQRENLEGYVSQEGLGDGGVIVDVGWHGSIQKKLGSLFGWNLTGYYLGIDALDLDNAHGYLYDRARGTGADIEVELSAFTGLLECFLRDCHHGSTLEHMRDEEGVFRPVIGEEEVDTQTTLITDAVGEGALAYVRDHCGDASGQEATIESRTALTPLARIGLNPAMRDVKHYGAMSFSNGMRMGHLVEARSCAYYVAHPQEAKESFLSTTWKTGWMRAVFLLPINYATLYARARAAFHAAEDREK